MIKDFDYFSPKTLKEALTLLDRYRDEYKIIAGGQSLLILMRQGLVAPENLIDIYGISELKYIKSDGKKGIRIGALTTHREVEKSELLNDGFRVLPEMEHRLASIQTRNRGTLAGNICHGDPAGDPAPVLMALGARLKLANVKRERTVSMEEFSIDYFETVLGTRRNVDRNSNTCTAGKLRVGLYQVQYHRKRYGHCFGRLLGSP